MCDCLFRAEKFGVLITAHRKDLNEGCESRDNHRYVVVVQDRFILSVQKQNLQMRRKKAF